MHSLTLFPTHHKYTIMQFCTKIDKCKLMPDTEGSSRFRIRSEARDSKAKITRERGLTGLDQHKMSTNPN